MSMPPMQLPQHDDLRALSLFAPDVRRQHIMLRVRPTDLPGLGEGHARSAEVIFVVRRPSGEVLLVNKAVYPPDTFRLPSGGIEPGETPLQAARREIREETGYQVAAPGLLGVTTYTLYWTPADRRRFTSVIFLAEVPAGVPPHAEDGEVDAYRWVFPPVLDDISTHLRDLPGDWVYWGRFRAAAFAMIRAALLELDARFNSRTRDNAV